MPDKNLEIRVQPPPSRYRRNNRPIIETVTPEDLKTARTRAQRGRPDKLYDAMEFFRSLDDEIPSAMQSLIDAVIQDTMRVATVEDSEAAARQQAFVEAVLADLDVVSLSDSLLWGHYYGLSAPHELVWDAFGFEGTAYQAPVTYEELPHDWIYAAKVGDEKFTTIHVGDRPFHAYANGHVLLYQARKLPSMRDIDFTMFGRGLAAARYGIFSWYGSEDWAAAVEALGIPPVIGTLMQGFNEDDKKLLEQAVMNITSDARAIVTERGKIQLLSDAFKASSSTMFTAFLDACARAKARIIKSESLTDNMNKFGSNAAMVTANGIRLDVARGLARRLQSLITRRLLHPLLDLNFDRRLVTIEVKVKEVQNLVDMMRIYTDAATKLGLPLSRQQVREVFGFQAPADDADTLSAGGSTFNPFGGA